MRSTHFLRLPLAMLAIALPALAAPQESRPGRPPAGEGPEFPFDGPFGGPPMRGPGPMGQHRKVVKDFDKDGDGRLDREERQAAREALKQSGNGRGRRGPGGPPGGFGRGEEPGRPGPKVAPADVKTFANAPLYQEDVVRTLFLQFADQDWEQEMADFFHTDVEVPAELTVDGRKYPGVGVRFRGASSFFMVPAGSKRSLNVSLDFTDSKQRLYGHKTLNLLNAHEDESFLHTVLYLDIARNFLPAPKANFVKVVINGESWGIYTSAQQFNKEFIAEHWKNSKGERWKVPGSPQGQGGLDYLGEEVAPYKQRYELNSGESEAAWQHLIALCRTLSQTDLEHLEEALAPMLDIDGALWFLALENVLVNNDGYWVRASDYALFRDSKGVFHVLPHDANETFSMAAGGPPGMGGGPGGRRGRGGRGPGGNGPGGNGPGGEGPGGFPGGPGGQGPGAQGPGRGGRGMGPGGGGVDLDPLVGMNEQRKPLRSRLLAVPALRQRYLQHVKQLATEWLDWKKLGPMVARYRTLLRDEIQADTRKLSSYEAFLTATDDHAPATEAAQGERRRPEPSLRAFAERRRSYLLAHPALK